VLRGLKNYPIKITLFLPFFHLICPALCDMFILFNLFIMLPFLNDFEKDIFGYDRGSSYRPPGSQALRHEPGHHLEICQVR
jgi:hypothetical protein